MADHIPAPPERRAVAVAASVVSVARSQNRTSEDTKGNEPKRRAEAAATTGRLFDGKVYRYAGKYVG